MRSGRRRLIHGNGVAFSDGSGRIVGNSDTIRAAPVLRLPELATTT